PMIFQQSQAVSAPSRYKPPQLFNQNIQYQNRKDWKTPSTPPIIRLQPLQPRYSIKKLVNPKKRYIYHLFRGGFENAHPRNLGPLDRRILEALDNFMFELRKGRETKDGNKECEALVYYQKPVDPNQYETRTSGICRRNDNEVETIVNDANSRLPELEFDDLVLDLIDEYLVEESVVEVEKEDIQEPSNDKIDVNNDVTKSEKESDINEIGVESQALPYDQKPVEAAETSLVSGTIEPGFKRRVEMKNGFPVDHRKTVKMDGVTKTELDELKQKEKMKIENVPEDVEGEKPSASAIKEERVALDLNPIEDICYETKDREDLDNNHQQSLNMDIRMTNNLEKDVGNSGSSGAAVMYKISNDKDGKEQNEKKVVIRDAHLTLYCHPNKPLSI
ncbi:44134_t:CDS:2, partial [Gigaspora margarita]